jgi:hypothetical protein
LKSKYNGKEQNEIKNTTILEVIRNGSRTPSAHTAIFMWQVEDLPILSSKEMRGGANANNRKCEIFFNYHCSICKATIPMTRTSSNLQFTGRVQLKVIYF